MNKTYYQDFNMKFAWVNPTNVSKIAQALLQLDRTHLQEQYQLDAADFVDQLHRALEHYQNPVYPEGEIKRSTIEIIEHALIHLFTEVKAFIALLTPEAQQQLAQQFQAGKQFQSKN